MQYRHLLIALIIASALGLAALFIASKFIKSEGSFKPSMVVASSEDIAIGTPISASQLKLIELPNEAIPTGIKENMSSLIGRVAKTSISPGEIILESMLFDPNSSAGIAFAISPGKRAIAINVNEISAVAGFVTPGTYVDILFNSKDESGKYNSRIIIQRLMVLAVAQDRNGANEAKPKVVSSVTLEVSPQQAVTIDAARMSGNIGLILRNQTESLASIEDVQVQTKTSEENGVEVIRGVTLRIESGLNR